MSNWVYIDCSFRIENNLYSSDFSDKEKENYIKFFRRKTLKDIYKAMKHLDKIENCEIGWDRDVRFSIKPEFHNIKEKYHEGFNDNILVNIYGHVRWDSNEDNKFTNIIKEIWYNSNLNISHGIALIRDSWYGDTVLKYNSDLRKFIVEVSDTEIPWGLSNIQYFVKKFKVSKNMDWFRVGAKKYMTKDFVKNYKYYEKYFQDMGIPMKIIKYD